MNLQVIIIFIIATAILHVILQRMEELKKENDELKYQVELLNEIIEVLDESNKELRGQNEKQ